MKFECRNSLSLTSPDALEKIIEMQNFEYHTNGPLSDKKLFLVETLLKDSTAVPTALIIVCRNMLRKHLL